MPPVPVPKKLEEILHLTLNNIPSAILISDGEGKLWFANAAAMPPGKKLEEVIGKTLDYLFPPYVAQAMTKHIRRAQSAKAPVITMDRREDGSGGDSYFETYHTPLPDTAELRNAVLVTQKDITAMIVERERQEKMFHELVEALVTLIDRRDPYAAGHSSRVGSVAASLAVHLKLDDTTVEACRVAGSLMNLGKVMVPREILTKTTALTPDELKQIRKAILSSADILSLISFDMPVIPTLKQVLERYDGTGVPEGRKGENILPTARIVALANAFVAMVSPRAHRPGMSIEKAFEILSKDAGASFDPQLVKALAEHLKKNPELQQSLVHPAPEQKGAIVNVQD